MSEHSEDTARTAHAPRLAVETGPAPADEPAAEEREEGREPFIDPDDLQDAVGFIRGVGATAWKYAVGHPFTVSYGFLGLVLAVLILVIGLWDTIVIAVFVVVGAMIGQIRDGDNGIVHFFSRLFNRRR